MYSCYVFEKRFLTDEVDIFPVFRVTNLIRILSVPRPGKLVHLRNTFRLSSNTNVTAKLLLKGNLKNVVVNKALEAERGACERI